MADSRSCRCSVPKPLAVAVWFGCSVLAAVNGRTAVKESVAQQLHQAVADRKNSNFPAAIKRLEAVRASALQAKDTEALAWVCRELAATIAESGPPDLAPCLDLYRQASEAFDLIKDAPNAALSLLDAADAALQANLPTSQHQWLLKELENRFSAPEAKSSLAACFPAYWQYQGRCRLAEGQFQAAAEAYGEGRKSLSLSPHLSAAERSLLDAKLNGGRALALWRAGQVAESKIAFTQSLAVLEKNSSVSGVEKLEARQNFALALLSWNQPQEAAQRLEIALADAANAVPSVLLVPQLNLGLAQLANQQVEAARKILEKAWIEVQKVQNPGRRLRTEIATTRWLARRDAESAKEAAREAHAWLEGILAGKGDQALVSQRRWVDPLAAILAPELLLQPNGVNAAAEAMINVHGALFEADCRKAGRVPKTAGRLTLPAVQMLIPKNAAYVQVTSHLAADVGGRWEDTCSTLVISPDAPPAIQPGPLQLREWLQSLSRQWHEAMLDPNITATQEKELQALLQEGHELFWEPLQLLTQAEVIYFCVDGPLLEVPWACLLDKNGQPLLLGKSRIVFLSSPQAFVRAASSQKLAKDGPWLVVDAAVEVGSGATKKPSEGAVFPYTQLPLQVLSGAAEEAAVVAKIGTNTKLLKGSAATETGLREALEAISPSVWHFAGHGSVNEKADGDNVAARFWEGVSAPGGFDHLGLFFPNFGSKQGTAKADDWLSATEISELPLANTLLAVFSSCHGGRGLASSGEGRFDLARAAHLAGVRDVLVAAGPVWDKAALQFMQDFYQQISAGIDPAAAVWQAQKNLWQISRKTSLSESIRHAGPYRLVRHR